MENLSLEQMGKLVAHKTIELNSAMLSALNPRKEYLDYENPDEPPTDSYCCFCASGNLQLEKVEPQMDGRIHRGNQYIFMCTICSAVYKGVIVFREASLFIQ